MDIKILLIDDHPDLPSELAVLLFNAGYHVLNIADIEESFELISNHKPEMLILNNFTENHDVGIFQKFKSAATEALTVIFISEIHVSNAILSTSFDYGVDGYIFRPISDSDLIAKIDSLIGKTGNR